MQRLLWVIVLALKKIVESILIVVALSYAVLVFDIYINTEKLSKVDSSLNAFCQNVADNPNFTKSPVVFMVDRGTLVFLIHRYLNGYDLFGHAPFFIFPHHRTVILTEKSWKKDPASVKWMVAHELGHIQGGLKHFGPAKEMEKYANDFAKEIVK